jgi:ketosteroid isomerase-like protein
MAEQNAEIVRRGYELFAAGDLDGVVALFADEAEMPGGGGLGIEGTMGIRHGPEGMLRAMQEALDAFDDYRVEVEEIVDAGETAVVAIVRIGGRGKASGMEQEVRLAHLWFVHDGKATRGEVHRTLDAALKAARAGG